MSLAPCPSCSRHVRRSERACPFCSASVAFDPEPASRTPMQRLGRAAIFTFGAAVAAGTSGCAMNTLYGAAPDEGIVDAVAQSDSGNDAGLLAHYGGPPVDADVDAGGSSSDYGAPPPRDAGVDS